MTEGTHEETDKVVPMNRAERRASTKKRKPSTKAPIPNHIKLAPDDQEDFDEEGVPLVAKQKQLQNLQAQVSQLQAECNEHVGAIKGLMRRYCRRNEIDLTSVTWGWHEETKHTLIMPIEK